MKRCKYIRAIPVVCLLCMLCVTFVGCDSKTSSSSESNSATEEEKSSALDANKLVESDFDVKETIKCDKAGEHAITVNGESIKYINIGVDKTGDYSGDFNDVYGENSAISVIKSGELLMGDSFIKTAGDYAKALVAINEGATVNIADSLIKTAGNHSSGLVSLGGAINATNLTIETAGDFSPCIGSSTAGGKINVVGGFYESAGAASPAVYATDSIFISEAYLQSSKSQAFIVEPNGTVELGKCTILALNTDTTDILNAKSKYNQAILLYAPVISDGIAIFSMEEGALDNKKGDVFLVSNTDAEINLVKAEIANEDEDGIFLRACAADWGNEGSNGGRVTLNGKDQAISGNILVDNISSLEMNLSGSSTYYGSINPDGKSGEVNVNLEGNATWVLSGDSHVSSLTCPEHSIVFNGFKLFIGNKEYSE